jgi:hypothetical protein
MTLACEIASSPCKPKCSSSAICVSGEGICPVGWKACYGEGECIHPLKICSSEIATSPTTTAIPTLPADGISSWPPTVEGRVVAGGGSWPPITQSTWPPAILSTWPPTTATTDGPTVTHGACHCSSCCIKEDCNYVASCFPYCVNLYNEYEWTGGKLCDDMNPCLGLCTPTCACMGGCCVDQDCEILNSENPLDTNEYTCIGGELCYCQHPCSGTCVPAVCPYTFCTNEYTCIGGELCDCQHPCSGTCAPAVCPYTFCCTNEDSIGLLDPPYLIHECEVKGVICDDRNPCAGFCTLLITSEIATSPLTASTLTSTTDGILTWPPTVLSTWPPNIPSTCPPTSATTDAPTVTHGACH